MMTLAQIQTMFNNVAPLMTERCKRVWAASMADALGRGGATAVERATGIVRATIWQGRRDIATGATGSSGDALAADRQRNPGAGRKPKAITTPAIIDALKALVEPEARGDPETPLRWTALSTRTLAATLGEQGFDVSHAWVGTRLRELGFSLQSNLKTLEGKQHADRDAQFKVIQAAIDRQKQSESPCISVDTKKKELVGNYKNNGQTYRPKGEPIEVDTHDFMGELGRASPYGILDVFACAGWVSVGVSADTAEFAVASIRRWWNATGKQRYPKATSLMITADCGGSNGHRVRLWKAELQLLADELGIAIEVHHYPPGTSKWNHIEHSLFSSISRNWRGQPLVDYQTIISYITNTKTESGLTVQCELDNAVYEKGRKVSDKEFALLAIERPEFHGDWNYIIRPRHRPNSLE